MSEPNYYILLGGPEHLDWFEHFDEDALSQYFWTVPKDARIDETAFIYLTAPVSRIVGKVMIIGEPFYNINEFENPKTKNSWMAQISRVEYFKPRAELHMKGLRALFPDWGWLSYPRGKTKIPTEIRKPFLELMEGVSRK